jgi:hypothetical protein
VHKARMAIWMATNDLLVGMNQFWDEVTQVIIDVECEPKSRDMSDVADG